MKRENLPAIPTAYLPENWAQTLADEFEKSKSTVEKIVYGLRVNSFRNKKIWDRALSLAEQGEAHHKLQTNRLEALTADK